MRHDESVEGPSKQRAVEKLLDFICENINDASKLMFGLSDLLYVASQHSFTPYVAADARFVQVLAMLLSNENPETGRISKAVAFRIAVGCCLADGGFCVRIICSSTLPSLLSVSVNSAPERLVDVLKILSHSSKNDALHRFLFREECALLDVFAHIVAQLATIPISFAIQTHWVLFASNVLSNLCANIGFHDKVIQSAQKINGALSRLVQTASGLPLSTELFHQILTCIWNIARGRTALRYFAPSLEALLSSISPIAQNRLCILDAASLGVLLRVIERLTHIQNSTSSEWFATLLCPFILGSTTSPWTGSGSPGVSHCALAMSALANLAMWGRRSNKASKEDSSPGLWDHVSSVVSSFLLSSCPVPIRQGIMIIQASNSSSVSGSVPAAVVSGVPFALAIANALRLCANLAAMGLGNEVLRTAVIQFVGSHWSVSQSGEFFSASQCRSSIELTVMFYAAFALAHWHRTSNGQWALPSIFSLANVHSFLQSIGAQATRRMLGDPMFPVDLNDFNEGFGSEVGFACGPPNAADPSGGFRSQSATISAEFDEPFPAAAVMPIQLATLSSEDSGWTPWIPVVKSSIIARILNAAASSTGKLQLKELKELYYVMMFHSCPDMSYDAALVPQLTGLLDTLVSSQAPLASSAVPKLSQAQPPAFAPVTSSSDAEACQATALVIGALYAILTHPKLETSSLQEALLTHRTALLGLLLRLLDIHQPTTSLSDYHGTTTTLDTKGKQPVLDSSMSSQQGGGEMSLHPLSQAHLYLRTHVLMAMTVLLEIVPFGQHEEQPYVDLPLSTAIHILQDTADYFQAQQRLDDAHVQSAERALQLIDALCPSPSSFPVSEGTTRPFNPNLQLWLLQSLRKLIRQIFEFSTSYQSYHAPDTLQAILLRVYGSIRLTCLYAQPSTGTIDDGLDDFCGWLGQALPQNPANIPLEAWSGTMGAVLLYAARAIAIESSISSTHANLLNVGSAGGEVLQRTVLMVAHASASLPANAPVLLFSTDAMPYQPAPALGPLGTASLTQGSTVQTIRGYQNVAPIQATVRPGSIPPTVAPNAVMTHTNNRLNSSRLSMALDSVALVPPLAEEQFDMEISTPMIGGAGRRSSSRPPQSPSVSARASHLPQFPDTAAAGAQGVTSNMSTLTTVFPDGVTITQPNPPPAASVAISTSVVVSEAQRRYAAMLAYCLTSLSNWAVSDRGEDWVVGAGSQSVVLDLLRTVLRAPAVTAAQVPGLFSDLPHSHNSNLASWATMAMANLTNSAFSRDVLLKSNGVEVLLGLLRVTASESVAINILTTLINLSLHSTSRMSIVTHAASMGGLSIMLVRAPAFRFHNVRGRALMVLANLAADAQAAQVLAASGVIRELATLVSRGIALSATRSTVSSSGPGIGLTVASGMYCTATLANLAAFGCRDAVLSQGGIGALLDLARIPHSAIQAAVCQALTTLLEDVSVQQRILQTYPTVVPRLLVKLCRSPFPDVRTNAAAAFALICANIPSQHLQPPSQNFAATHPQPASQVRMAQYPALPPSATASRSSSVRAGTNLTPRLTPAMSPAMPSMMVAAPPQRHARMTEMVPAPLSSSGSFSIAPHAATTTITIQEPTPTSASAPLGLTATSTPTYRASRPSSVASILLASIPRPSLPFSGRKSKRLSSATTATTMSTSASSTFVPAAPSPPPVFMGQVP